ncbi:MAG: fumarylacetoacetate hydrolase family protein [Bdellovibrionales bacterium]|nr:fumarylacetoacetate hydrolase family protein [Bdellovibrionales bacterium]
MKWVTFVSKSEPSFNLPRVGWISSSTGQVLSHPQLPSTVLELIKSAENWQKRTTDWENSGTALKFERSSIQLLSPIPRPVSMRDGYAFRQHVEAARKNRGLPMIPEFDQFPVFYFTNHLAVVGEGDLWVQRQALEKLDFELEVAIVVGKAGKNIPASKADEHIFGFMVMNDWSARHLQMEEMKLNLGPAKGKDFATSLGPWLVTRDELRAHVQPGPNGERHNLKMRCFVNGKQVSFGNLKDMTWTFAQIIERASYGVTLEPGEVIGSGTVGTGCFLELNGSKITDNQWLKPGDQVALEVDALGRLENTIQEAKEDYVGTP